MTPLHWQIRPVTFSDFEKALLNCKSSVDAHELNMYREWDKKFGTGTVWPPTAPVPSVTLETPQLFPQSAQVFRHKWPNLLYCVCFHAHSPTLPSFCTGCLSHMVGSSLLCVFPRALPNSSLILHRLSITHGWIFFTVCVSMRTPQLFPQSVQVFRHAWPNLLYCVCFHPKFAVQPVLLFSFRNSVKCSPVGLRICVVHLFSWKIPCVNFFLPTFLNALLPSNQVINYRCQGCWFPHDAKTGCCPAPTVDQRKISHITWLHGACKCEEWVWRTTISDWRIGPWSL